MPWVVGIDEAGYGPNLGPFVQAAVVLHFPDDDVAGWTTLAPFVRRCHERPDNRILIDDSKKVHAGPNGFAKLERTVLGAMLSVSIVQNRPLVVSDIGIEHETINWLEQVRDEYWFDGQQAIPLTTTREDIWEAASEFLLTLRNTGSYGIRPLAVTAKHFNATLDSHGSKAAIPSHGLIRLMPSMMDIGYPIGAGQEPIHFVCDKQGGRNFYAPILQAAFPDGWVMAERESADESRYRIVGLPREVTVTFRPRADGDSVCVALASMVCKYLREVCMMQFNAFWQKHIPNLKPTAGYPVDAKRFYAAILPKMRELGIAEDAVWRKK